MSKLLTAEEILAVEDVEHIDVDVPEWGGTVRLRSLSAAAFDRLAAWQLSEGADKYARVAGYRMRVLSESMVGEDGERLFPTPELVDGLMERAPDSLDRLFERAVDLNKLGGEGQEDLAGN